MEKQLYRVKPGAVLAHDCHELPGGTDVELPPNVAYEVRHLLDPVDQVTGELGAWGAPAAVAIEAELAQSRPHERVSILETALAANAAHGDKLKTLLSDARKAEAVDARKSAKPKTDAPRVDGPKTDAGAPAKPASAKVQ